MSQQVNSTTAADTAKIDSGVRSEEAGKNVITIGGSSSQGGIGLSSIISLLLQFAAWMIVGIGYLCVPGSLIGGILGVVCLFMNLGTGIANMALCLGCAIACVGLFYPIFVGTRFLQHVLLKREGGFDFDKKTLLVFAVIAVAGAALAGLGVLIGGGAQLALPGFLQTIFAA